VICYYILKEGVILADSRAPGVEIKCDGKSLTKEAAKIVTDVMVESRLDLPGSFAVSLNDATLSSINSKDGQLREGVQLEIALGYDQKFSSLIKGEISAVSAEMSSLGVFARITGFDMLHRLSRGTNYRRYEDGGGEALADSKIAQNILNDAGLKPTVDDTGERSIPRVQDNRSDLDFLVMLSNLNNFYFYNEEDRVFFTASPPNRGELTLTWGKNLRTFYPRLNLNGLVNTLEIRGRDLALDESFMESADRDRKELQFLSSEGQDMIGRGSGGRSALSLHDPRIAGANDAKQFLPSATKNRQYLVSATGTCIGDSVLRAGTKLKIEGAGRFSGNYFVVRAVHRLNSRGYSTEFEARLTL
jgi:phage protein D